MVAILKKGLAMYRYIDQSPDCLTGGGHLLLWAMRAWAASAEQHRCPCIILRRSFADLQLIEILPDFHQVMLTLHRRGQQPLRFGGPGLSRITESEAVMLALWSDVAGGRERAAKVLALMLAEADVARAMAAMTSVALRMSAAGLICAEGSIICRQYRSAAKRQR